MFGISALSQSPFASTADAAAVYSASAAISSESEFTFLSSVLKPPASAFLASESGVSAFAETLKEVSGLVEAGSNVAANGTRYAVGSALVLSSSNSVAFGVRYAFGALLLLANPMWPLLLLGTLYLVR